MKNGEFTVRQGFYFIKAYSNFIHIVKMNLGDNIIERGGWGRERERQREKESLEGREKQNKQKGTLFEIEKD